MSGEVIKVLIARLRVLENHAKKTHARMNEVAPIEELIKLQQRAFEFIRRNENGCPPSISFLSELRKFSAEEKSIKAKIAEIHSRDFGIISKHLSSTESKIHEIKRELWILGFREEIKGSF